MKKPCAERIVSVHGFFFWLCVHNQKNIQNFEMKMYKMESFDKIVNRIIKRAMKWMCKKAQC